jgi:hypothetical protein
MALNPESKYPNRRAYVLKMRSDAKPNALAGRLENLVTGQQREFSSGRELLDSIACDLETSAGEPSASQADGKQEGMTP